MAVVNPGQRFGFLTALYKIREGGRTYWAVQCDCGAVKRLQQAQLHGAKRPSRSCGCQRIALLRKAHTTHGCSVSDGTRQYATFICWQSMIWRCTNTKRKDFASYGGRGIKVCARWRDSFDNFLSDMGVKPPRTSIGRIDNDGDYCPKNCRWESAKQQARNKRSNRVLDFQGESRTVVEWAEVRNLRYGALKKRLENGWSVERALTQPMRGCA